MIARTLTKALHGRWHGGYGTVRCPAHDDRHPSLSITERDGKLLVHCHAGCDQGVVWDALWTRRVSGDHHAPEAAPRERDSDVVSGHR